MPNWCENELTIKGLQGVIDIFLEFSRGAEAEGQKVHDFCLPKMLPPPLSIKDPNPSVLSNAEYDWREEHWGTKWDVDLQDSNQVTEGEHLLMFLTAWAPPEAAIVEVSKQFPGLEFTLEYWECGVGFSGKTVVENGEMKLEEYNPNYDGERGG